MPNPYQEIKLPRAEVRDRWFAHRCTTTMKLRVKDRLVRDGLSYTQWIEKLIEKELSK